MNFYDSLKKIVCKDIESLIRNVTLLKITFILHLNDTF